MQGASEQDNQHAGPAEGASRAPGYLQDVSLSVLETLLNTLAALDPQTQAAMRERAGFVVRVRTTDPYMNFHIRFTQDGIELSTRSPGPAQVRVQASFLSLAAVIIGGVGLHSPDRIAFWGDEADRAWFMDLLQDYNLRTSVQRWLRDHVQLEELWRKISRHDPSWIADLMPIPGMMKEALLEIRQLRKQLEAQQEAWQAHQERLQQQRRWDIVMTSIALVILVLSLLPGQTLPERLNGLTTEHLLWVALAVTLIGSRLRQPD